MRGPGLRSLFCLSILVGTMLACTPQTAQSLPAEDAWGVVEIARGETIRLGVGISLTDTSTSDQGTDQLREAEIAVQQAHTLHGFQIELVPLDTHCSAEGGITAAEQFTDDPSIVAVVGHSCSTSCDAAVRIYERAHYTIVSPSCTASRLTAEATHLGAFTRVIYDDRFLGQVAAHFAYDELGAREAAVIHDGSLDNEGLATAFALAFQVRGGEIVSTQQISRGTDDVRPVLIPIAQTNDVDLVFASVQSAEAALIATQRAGAGLGAIPLLGTTNYWTNYFIAKAGYTSEGVYASGPLVIGKSYENFLQEYIRVYGESPRAPYQVHAYDAVNLILNAIEKVGVVDRNGVLHIGREALRRAIYSTSTFEGLTGVMTCTELGDCGVEQAATAQVRDGQWVVVYAP